jgi:hypothetical protein
MKEDFVMRGQTASGLTETLNFGGHKDGYGFILTEFAIYPSTSIGSVHAELAASITAAKTFEDPSNPNFNNEGLIAVATRDQQIGPNDRTNERQSIVNDTFVITQDLILAVIDTVAGLPMAVNWQCKFRPVKLDTAKQALTNYRQFQIFDE